MALIHKTNSRKKDPTFDSNGLPQVESRLDPSLVGVPMAVVQYNSWQGGGIIAVSYEARAHGVTRNMRGDEARKKCPEIK